MIRVRRIDHVALRIDDRAASEGFYTGLLGLPLLDAKAIFDVAPDFTPRLQEKVSGARVGTRGGFWVKVGDAQLHMLSGDETKGVANPFSSHLALEVEDFDEAKQTLDERGLQYVEAPASALPFRQVWLTDPSGNTIELWARRDEQSD